MVGNMMYSVFGPRIQVTPLKSIAEDALSAVNSILDWCGEACVTVLNAGLNIFQIFVENAYTVLTSDLGEKGVFSSFWGGIGVLIDVFIQISATLMVLLFLVGMANDAISNRHEMELFSVVKDFLKLSIAVVLVEYSKKIVLGIFNAGVILAKYSFQLVTGKDIATIDLKVDGALASNISTSIGGLKGLFLFLLFLIGTIILIGTGLMICLEVYQRIFKLFLLIPFSALSFSFFAIGNGNPGNEVFHGYVKNIISTSLEAVVISVCLGFMLILMAGVGKPDTTMDSLFPSEFSEVGDYTITVKNNDDYMVLTGLNDLVIQASQVSRSSLKHFQVMFDQLFKTDVLKNTSGGFRKEMYSLNLVGFLRNSDGKWVKDIDWDDYWYSAGWKDGSVGDILDGNARDYEKPYEFVFFKPIDFKRTLFVLLQFLFPCILGIGAIKQSPQIAGMVMGK